MKKGGKVWKRLRHSLRGQRDEKEFRAAARELADLRAQAQRGEIDLFYYDEAGFTLTPSLPYAWQTVGATQTLPCANSPRLNVLGFFSEDLRLVPFVFEATVDSEVVIACFENFCTQVEKPTVVVMDGAPTHTSAAFEAQRDKWQARGLFIYDLPAYSPELNLIEILWRMIKYHWLPLAAFASYKQLTKELLKVLKQVGSKYQINFAS